MASRSSIRPESVRYWVTTLDPGANDVLTHGLRVSPRARALRATSPAPTMTSGFEVLVQLVIAAITTSPWLSWNDSPSYSTDAATSSCGRLFG